MMDEVLELIEEAGIVTTQDIIRILELSPAKARKYAADLMKSGKIHGHKRGGGWVYWHPTVVVEDGTWITDETKPTEEVALDTDVLCQYVLRLEADRAELWEALITICKAADFPQRGSAVNRAIAAARELLDRKQ